MPIDWGTTLGAIDQDTAAMLARRQLEQQGLMNVLKEQDALRTSASNRAGLEEQRKTQAQLREAQTLKTNLDAVKRLRDEGMTPGDNITDNQIAQDLLKKTGQSNAMENIPAVPATTIAPVTAVKNVGEGLPGMNLEGNAAPAAPVTEIEQIEAAKEQSGQKPQVMYKGTKKEIFEQGRVKAISDYTDAMKSGDKAAAAEAEQTLKLKYGIRTGQFGDAVTHVYQFNPDGTKTDLGTVEKGSRVNFKSTAVGDQELDPTSVDMYARLIARTGDLKRVPLGRGGMGSVVGQQISKRLAEMVQSGEFSNDLAMTKTAYDVAASTYKTLSPKYTMTRAAALTASDSLVLAQQAAMKVGETGYRTDMAYWNKMIQPIMHSMTAMPKLTDAEQKAFTAAREFVKVTGGAAMSVAEVNQHAAETAAQMLSLAKSPADFNASIDAMNDDMQQVVDRQEDQLNDSRRTIAGTGKTSTDALGPSSPRLDLRQRVENVRQGRKPDDNGPEAAKIDAAIEANRPGGAAPVVPKVETPPAPKGAVNAPKTPTVNVKHGQTIYNPETGETATIDGPGRVPKGWVVQ